MTFDTLLLLAVAAAAIGAGVALVADFEHHLLGDHGRAGWRRRRLKD